MAATGRVTFSLFFLGLGVTHVASLIEPIPLPKDLDVCIESKTAHYNMSHTPLHMIQEYCLRKFLFFNSGIKLKVNFTVEEDNYINSLFRQVFADSSDPRGHGRVRRQAFIRRKYRREVRSAPYSHWQQYISAVHRLKRDWTGENGRNRYDTIAAIHTAAVDVVHFGPAFLPWHRIYLILFETAIGVPIPYWDCTIDNELDDPAQSIVWTSKYFGNGRGYVTNGPFSYFETPTGPLLRDIGDDGMLFSKQNLQRILRQSWNSEISEPNFDSMDTLEGQHNQVHFWVGGHTNEFEVASYDPLFWNLHAYVDFVWEVFRGVQRRRGINPERDVASSFVSQQDPDQPVFGFRGLTLRDGYSSRFSNMVSYDPLPKCPECGNSPDMYCNRVRRVCVSATRSVGLVRRRRVSPLNLASAFNGRNNRRRRLARSISFLPENFRNSTIDNSIDTSSYAFVPVKVIRTDRIENEIKRILKTDQNITQIINPTCIQHPTTVQKDIIYVQSEGINYIGKYKDSINLNESSELLIGIKKPENTYSETYLTAFDRCGRICVPNCLVPGTYPSLYKTCAGSLRATMEKPLMFISFSDVTEKNNLQVNQQANTIPIIFHCGW